MPEIGQIFAPADWRYVDRKNNPDHTVARRITLPRRQTREINMQWRTALLTLTCALLAAGCAAHSSKPVIDPAGVDMAQYETDVAECEQIATQVDQKAGQQAAEGAVVGGLIGAVVGGSDSALTGAGVGAIAGGASGSADTQREKSTVVKNCLRNRGYKVLN